MEKRIQNFWAAGFSDLPAINATVFSSWPVFNEMILPLWNLLSLAVFPSSL